MIPRKQPKILIVDDDPAIVKALSTRCEKMGFAIDTASNGMQMVLKARRTGPDLIIVDVNIPQLDGLTASFRLLQPGGCPMDVIVVTGNSSEETIECCEAMGMFYARKGEDFWSNIRIALTEIFPHMADAIAAQSGSRVSDAVPKWPRILIVDDDEEVGIFLGSRLNKLGIETLCASNAAQAMRLATKRQPSVIITDCYMPEGDADFLMTRLRAVPETAHTPVIVLSGKDIDKHTANALTGEVLGHPGAVKIFKKSFDVSDLFQTIEEFCAFRPSAAIQ
jgi:CheY-like chemotaxis protein